MRWQGQSIGAQVPGALPGLDANDGLVRTVRTPEFAGITFHEVLAKSALNRIPAAAQLPFEWTVNPYRGCTHACVYCFARNTHTYLDLDAGRGLRQPDRRQDQRRRRAARASCAGRAGRATPVALGTNTDPYQRAEGRYRLMPGIIAALAGSGTPFSILTKGTIAKRDLPLLTAAARDVHVGFGVSIAIGDEELHQRLEPGTSVPQSPAGPRPGGHRRRTPVPRHGRPGHPAPQRRRRGRRRLLSRIAAAGATSATVMALHLRPGTREWWFAWLEREHPELLPAYRSLYARGAFATPAYRDELARRVRPLLERHGLGGRARAQHREVGTVTTKPAATVPTLFSSPHEVLPASLRYFVRTPTRRSAEVRSGDLFA